jgi:hypothetical protein
MQSYLKPKRCYSNIVYLKTPLGGNLFPSCFIIIVGRETKKILYDFNRNLKWPRASLEQLYLLSGIFLEVVNSFFLFQKRSSFVQEVK